MLPEASVALGHLCLLLQCSAGDTVSSPGKEAKERIGKERKNGGKGKEQGRQAFSPGTLPAEGLEGI